ncbi:hypothetical protein [Actinophytocola xanthii]|nr:hypothetical protein [Actinophytocola xanthii]
MFGVLGLLVVVVGGFAVWFYAIRDPLKGEDFYKFHVEQKWAWQLTMTPEQEKALMAGLEAFDDDEGCYPMREEGVLRVYDPMMLISLFSLAEQFVAMGPAAMRDPARAVRELVTRAAQSEVDGVLHLSGQWLGDTDTVDGMDKYEFTDALMAATHAQGVDCEFAGGFADENRGFATMGVLARSPGHVRQLYDDAHALAGEPRELRNRLDVVLDVMEPENPEYVAAFERAEAEKSKYVNTVMFCFERVVEQYRAARPHLRYAEPSDVLSVVMGRMLEHHLPGCTWTRPPSPEQHSLALAVLRNR